MGIKKIDEINYSYSIRKVKDISFYVNEFLLIPDPNKIIKIELDKKFGVDLKKNLIDFTLISYLHYNDSRKEEILAEIRVQNIFEVLPLNDFTRDNGLFLPNNLIVAILSMSISHTRALFFRNLSGTVLQDIILPITNPSEVAKQFFPQMFPEKKEENYSTSIAIAM